jgi:hypothetical protein
MGCACRKYAWGHDEVNPKAHVARDWFQLGLTIVDSLDTLLITQLDDEYQEARQWVANHLDMEQYHVSVRTALVHAYMHAHTRTYPRLLGE